MSCFGGRDEQIYLIEILIDRLTLTPAKIKDIAGHPIVIKIKLLDFPVFEIARDDADTSKVGPDDGSVRFAIGRCCLRVMRPQDLIRGLRSTCPLKIGVFRAGDTYPTAETELTLPGCLCDQAAMAGNDPDNLPKPFTVKGGFHLLDPGENPSGTLHMELVVACLGRVLAVPHELHPKTPAFIEGQDKERELRLRRLVPSEFLPGAVKEAEVVPPEVAKLPKKKKAKKKQKATKKKKKGKK